jgi:phage shock protein PspC (stress-responsive transcriptional regulator)
MMNDVTSRKLYRARRGAWLAGVAKGIANWSGLPVALVRLIWLLFLLPGGVPGVLLYLVCWVLIPRAPAGLA